MYADPTRLFLAKKSFIHVKAATLSSEKQDDWQSLFLSAASIWVRFFSIQLGLGVLQAEVHA
ncbi:hypothetical protein HBZS_124190 [Helicobacter bizzozeronii CCUG 35545]|nr:hypothetical protein HBZS_124190 [Helicobacter bizzozeronii CCUG 35545]